MTSRPAIVPKSGRFAACSRRARSRCPDRRSFLLMQVLACRETPGKREFGLDLDSTRFCGRADVFALGALRVAAPQTCPPAAWRMPRRRRRWASRVPRVGATCGSRGSRPNPVLQSSPACDSPARRGAGVGRTNPRCARRAPQRESRLGLPSERRLVDRLALEPRVLAAYRDVLLAQLRAHSGRRVRLCMERADACCEHRRPMSIGVR